MALAVAIAAVVEGVARPGAPGLARESCGHSSLSSPAGSAVVVADAVAKPREVAAVVVPRAAAAAAAEQKMSRHASAVAAAAAAALALKRHQEKCASLGRTEALCTRRAAA